MSHLAQELKKILRDKDVRPADVAREMGMEQSLLSRILNGKNIISREKMEVLLDYFKDPIDSAKLVAAYLQDYKFGKGAEFVKISVKGSFNRSPVIEVSPNFERAWEYLRGQDGDEAVEQLIINLAVMRGLPPKRK